MHLLLPVPIAFGFANPWLLLGLAAAAAPILIHLLFRRPQREIPWAAMLFLMRAIQRQSKRMRAEQLLLLAVRTLLLLLVALAMARPFLEAAAPTVQGPTPPVHRILLIDTSYSMGYTIDGVARFERARQTARDIVSAGQPGDATHLLQMTSLGSRSVIGQAAHQPSLVLEALDDLQPTAGRADPVATLRDLLPLLRQAGRIPRKEVILLTDFQQVDWLPTGETGTALRQLLSAISEQATVRLVDVSRDAAGAVEIDPALAPTFSNTAVSDLAIEADYVRTGQPVRCVATLQQFGEPIRRTERVELFIDGVLAGVESVSVRRDENATVTFSPQFTSPGDHLIEARLAGDALPTDDRRHLTVQVRDRLRVLLVNGAGGRNEAASTFYLQKALAPTVRGIETDFAPTVIDEGKLAGTELSDFDVVFLSNVALLSEREQTRLRSFAAAGGGVIIALGDQVRLPAYRQAFADAANSLLPVRFEDRVGDPRQPAEAFQFDTADLSHPIVRPFEGNPGTGLETDFVLAYATVRLDEIPAETSRSPMSPPEESGAAPDAAPGVVPGADPRRSATVVLRYDTGDPAIITGSLGLGRVVLITTSVDTSWAGPWPLVGRSYLPLMHETTRYSAIGQPVSRSSPVGSPLVWRTAARLADPEVRLIRPDGRTEMLKATVSPDGSRVAIRDVTQPGAYRLEPGAPVGSSVLFAANVDATEGDLTALSEEQRKTLLPDAAVVTAETPLSSAAPVDDSPLSRWLLAGALGLLLVEPLLSWRFAWGVIALLVLVFVAIARVAWLFDHFAGIVVMVFAIGATAAVVVWARRGGVAL